KRPWCSWATTSLWTESSGRRPSGPRTRPTRSGCSRCSGGWPPTTTTASQTSARSRGRFCWVGCEERIARRDTMLDIVITELRELAVTVLLALLSVGAAYALAYIRRAREALEQRVDHELADRALERVAHLAEVFVLAAESKLAAALRQAVAEGRVSREELVALGRQVVEQVLAQLDDEARMALA